MSPFGYLTSCEFASPLLLLHRGLPNVNVGFDRRFGYNPQIMIGMGFTQTFFQKING